MNNINAGQFLSIEQLQDQYLNTQGKTRQAGAYEGKSFGQILDETSGLSQSSELKFSKHAMARLQDRDIELTGDQLERLSDGTKKAGEKGINESLVIVDELAFIVNIKNNTVITAMDQNDTTRDNVFTNIDGAVIT